MEKKTGLNKLWKLFLPAMLLAMLLGISAMAEGTQSVNLTLGEAYAGELPDTSTTVNHVISVPGKGALSVFGVGPYGGLKVTLYDSNWKEMGSGYVYADSGNTYGVQKGIYYLQVSGYSKYAVQANYTKFTDNGGASKKKAKTIKLNKTVYGVMPFGEKKTKADWFKVKVTKSKKLRVDLDTIGTGYFDFYVYGPSCPKGIRLGSLYNTGGTAKIVRLGTNKEVKVKKGTYYIKVVRNSGSAAGSGVYSIKCKLK